MILNVSGSIGYPFRSGFGSDNTHNPKYQKTGSIRYLCRIRIGSDSFLSDRVRFGFSGSVYLPSPIEEHLSLQNLLICSSPGFLEKRSPFCQYLKHLSFLLYLMEFSCLALNSLSEVHRQKKHRFPTCLHSAKSHSKTTIVFASTRAERSIK